MIHSVMTSAFALSVLLVASSVLAICLVFGLVGRVMELGVKHGILRANEEADRERQ